MGFILSLSQLDVLPTETIYDWFFTFDEDDEALNPFFEQVGYESTNSMRNMGSTFIFVVFNLVSLPILWLIQSQKFASYKFLKMVAK